MDDLTQIPGIGAATAKKLAAAGFDSFAKLAATTTSQLEAADVGGRPSAYGDWIESAKAKAEKRTLSDDEIAALVVAWDTARTKLNAAGDAVSAVQGKLAALGPDDDRTALEEELAKAQHEASQANAAIDALQPLPPGTKLPDANKPEPPEKPKRAGTSQASETPAEPGATKTGAGTITITVIGPTKGRRRAGYSFGAAPQTISVTAEQLELIKADAGLAVTNGALPNQVERAAVQQRLSADDFKFDGLLSIQVLGPAKGRRRAGFEFGAQARTVEVTRDQLQFILDDHSLAVTTA